MLSRSFLIAVVLGFSLIAGTPQKNPARRMNQTGEFHGDEASARNGERWLALLLDPTNGDRISQVVVHVERVWDAIVDEPGAKTGKKITIPEGNDGVFLFRGIPSIRPRSIETICTIQTLKPNAPVDLVLSTGRSYQLTLVCSQPECSKQWQRSTASLVLQCGDQRQVLRTYQASYEKGEFVGVGQEGEIRVLWAGDLNGDGALDFIIDLTDHYNMALPTLFLGTKKGAEGLVAKSAQQMTLGC